MDERLPGGPAVRASSHLISHRNEPKLRGLLAGGELEIQYLEKRSLVV